MGSKLVLGGINKDYAETPMKYYPLSDPTYWKIALDSIAIGDNKTSDLHAIVDTGTSVIVGPKSMVDKLIEGLPANPDCS